MSLDLAVAKIGDAAHATAVEFAADNDALRRALIGNADAVISMLPVALHLLVAKDCIALGKSLFNASYVSPELRQLESDVKAKGLLFLCELGLDPGIDHMSAMQLIHQLRHEGATLEAFRSYTGGLVAPAYDDNPWHYKFTWNPRNVVVAGQSTAKYLYQHQYKYVPYQRLFAEAESVEIPSLGTYEIYPNRDSLSYRSIYGLEHIPTLVRATIRHKGFSRAWNIFVQLGMTDDTYTVEHSDTLTYRQFFAAFLPPAVMDTPADIERVLCQRFGLSADDEILNQLRYLDLYADEPINRPNATPAQILQQRLEQKWVLQPTEKDLIIMQHEFVYTKDGKRYQTLSTLIQEGEDAIHTAMANLVGLPLAIGVKQYLLGNIQQTGVHIPILPSIYEPILAELETLGVRFVETTTCLD